MSKWFKRDFPNQTNTKISPEPCRRHLKSRARHEGLESQSSEQLSQYHDRNPPLTRIFSQIIRMNDSLTYAVREFVRTELLKI